MHKKIYKKTDLQKSVFLFALFSVIINVQTRCYGNELCRRRDPEA